MKAFRKSLLVSLVMGAALFLAGRAYAQTCTVSVRSNVVFGAYDPLLSGNLNTTAQVRVRCTPPRPPFTLKFGTGAAGSYTPRRMFKGAESLTYNLYLDGSYATVWGDGTSGTSFITNNNPVGTQDYTLYARTPLGQDVSAGTYTDVVTVTVEF